MAARNIGVQEYALDGSDANPGICFTTNKVLAADVAETFTVPSWTTAASATKYADFVEISGTANFYVSYFPNTYELDVTTNGAFASDTSWTKGTGWTIAAGVATSDASQAGNSELEQAPPSTSPLIEGQAYKVVFTVTAYTAGNVRANIGGGLGTNRASASTFTETIVAGSSANVGLRADLDFAGSVDNLSITPVAFVPTADIETGGYGMDLGVSAAGPIKRSLANVKSISVISAATCNLSMRFFRS